MPEGDTIHRAALALNRALAGRTVTRFESVFSSLTRVHDERPLLGRTVERVDARGKHLLIWFSGDLVLRTHMRMHGSWHIYRPGERWQRPHGDMRIVIGTPDYEAVAFTVPIAEFTSERDLARDPAMRGLGPDLLADDFDVDDAIHRIAALADVEIADALLDQRAVAGIGNIFKSESLFVARINPFAPVGALSPDALGNILITARRLMRANVTGAQAGRARPWVYGRAGLPCPRCGTPISRRKQGVDPRSTYWCERCQLPTTKKPTSKGSHSKA